MMGNERFGEGSSGFLTDAAASFLLWIFICAVIFFFPVESIKTRALYDETQFHWPTILHFVNGGSVSDYPSATAPGYHFLICFWVDIFGPEKSGVRFFSAIATGVLFFAVLRLWRGATPRPLYYALPSVLCIYGLPGGVWLTPDNLSWFVNLTIMIVSINAASKREGSSAWCIAVGGLGAVAILLRQSSVWVLLAPLFALYASSPKFLPAIGRGVLLLAPPFAVLICFLFVWGGLTPPAFQTRHAGLNFAAWPYFFACFFAANIWLVFFVPAAAGAHWKRISLGFFAGVLLGLLLLLFVDVSYHSEFRSGGLWELSRFSRRFVGESVLIAFLSVLGSGLFFATLSMVDRRMAAPVMAILVAFVACMAMNKYTYDRYYFLTAVVVVPVMLSNWIVGGVSDLLGGKSGRLPYAFSYLYALAGYATLIKG